MIKKILTLLILTFVFSYSSTSWAQNIRFVHNQLTKAKTKAKKKSKILFVDAYASWCGPCKMMDKNIFTDPTVVKFHKTNFVNCKIDVESVVGEVFTDKHPIKSIPTLFYFNSDYDLIFKKVGAPSQAEDLIEYGQTAFDVDQHLRNKTPITNPQSLYHYTYYLKEADANYKPYLKAFLETQENWASKDPMQMIFDFASEEDSVALNYFITHIDEFERVYGKDEVQEKRMMLVLDVILEFLDNSNDTPNFADAQPIFIKYFGEKDYLEHLLLFKYRYHQQHNEKAEMRNTLEQFVHDVIEKMPDGKEKGIEYIQAATNYYDLSEGREDLQSKALEWGETAAKLYQGYEVFSILAILYKDVGLSEKAKFYQDKANKSKKD